MTIVSLLVFSFISYISDPRYSEVFSAIVVPISPFTLNSLFLWNLYRRWFCCRCCVCKAVLHNWEKKDVSQGFTSTPSLWFCCQHEKHQRVEQLKRPRKVFWWAPRGQEYANVGATFAPGPILLTIFSWISADVHGTLGLINGLN